MSRRTVKAFNSANTYLLGLLFCACVIVSTNVDNEGKGTANTGHNERFSRSTTRNINGERTTTFTTHQGGTLDESEESYQMVETTWKHETLNETRALHSTVQTTDIMPSTTYNEHEFTTISGVTFVAISQDKRQISERMLQLYAENDTIGLTAVAVSGLCPEWIPCYDAKEFHSIARANNSCCMPCKCDDSCISTRNCCPGYESSYTQGQHVQDLELPHICFNTAIFTNRVAAIEKAPYHDMVASCPDKTPQGLKNKCSAVLQNAKTNQEFIHAFSDVIPVTDSVTVTNFLNVHCATCNGITNEKLIFWKAKFSCDYAPVPITGRDVLERYIQERDECHLLLLPPNNLIGNVTRCFNNVETRCNITGLWREYDHEVEGFCNRINWLYYPLGTFKWYKNIFCAICNGELNIRSHHLTCPSEHQGNIQLSFTGMLNFKGNTGTGISLSAAFDLCPVGQLFDPLKGACQNVVCSVPRVLNYITNECDNLFDEITYGIIELPFEIFPKEPFYFIDIPYYEHAIKKVIRDVIGIVDCSMYSTFYKLDIPFTYADEANFRNVKITSVIIIVATNIRSIELRRPSETISLYLNVSKWASIPFRYDGRSDFFNLPSSELEIHDDSVKYMYINDAFLLGPTMDNRLYAMHEDPYDGAAVLHVGRIEFYNSPCTTPYLFDKYHFECPSFLYDIERAGMVRVRHGILLIDRNITLTFGEFKSMNATHVAVCIESISKVFVSQSSSGNDLSLAFAFLNQLIITFGIMFSKLVIYV